MIYFKILFLILSYSDQPQHLPRTSENLHALKGYCWLCYMLSCELASVALIKEEFRSSKFIVLASGEFRELHLYVIELEIFMQQIVHKKYSCRL